MTRKFLIAAMFVLPVLILLPGLDQFIYHPASAFSDIPVSHYPNGLFLQRILSEQGLIPLWANGILSGYPFAANPLAGLFYLPGWLALPFPLPLGFHLLVVLHLMWGGWGMYLLLRAEGLQEGPALLGGLLFEASPKLFAHLGAGHLTLLYAVPWTPWLLYAQCRAAGCLKASGVPALLRLTPGLVLGTIALADVRWAPYAGLAWAAYSLRPMAAPRVAAAQAWQRTAQVAVGLLQNGVLAGLVAAPLLLPLLEYSALSTRAAMTNADRLIQSLNPAELLGLFFPYLRAPAEAVLYPGAVAMAAFCLTLAVPSLRRRAAYWLGLTAAALLFALGSSLPMLAWITGLPGFDLLRVPPRALFLAGLGFAAVAAYTLDGLLRGLSVQDERRDGGRMVNLVVFGLLIFVILVGGGVAMQAESAVLRLQFGWGALLFSLALSVLLAARAGRGRRRITPGGLTVLLVVLGLGELSAVNAIGLTYHSFGTVASQGAAVASYLVTRDDPHPLRVYSPSYSLPQQVAGLYRLELADGVDPLQLAAYAAYMRKASGVPATGYSVTLPPFANGEPTSDNRAYVPDAHRLGLLNVKYVVAEYALSGSQLRLLARIGETRIYENPFYLPRVWVQSADAQPGTKVLSTPAVVMGPNRIRIPAAQGAGLLVLSEMAYPGWQVRVDGQPAQMEVVAGILRAVRLPPGTHVVQFEFRPTRVYIGLALAGLAWLLVLGLAAWQVLADRRRVW